MFLKPKFCKSSHTGWLLLSQKVSVIFYSHYNSTFFLQTSYFVFFSCHFDLFLKVYNVKKNSTSSSFFFLFLFFSLLLEVLIVFCSPETKCGAKWPRSRSLLGAKAEKRVFAFVASNEPFRYIRLHEERDEGF